MAQQNDRILVITQFYAPEPNFITKSVADALATDARVTVITAHPNYPFGRFYDDGRRHWWPARERDGNVTVWRLPIYPDHSRSKLKRTFHYLSFTLAATLIAPFVAGRPHVVWVYQTPFTAGIAALWFKLAYRSRLVFTCADLWPESFLATGISRPGAAVRLAFRLRHWLNTMADTIIGTTRGTCERFQREGISPDRLVYIPVWIEGIPEGAPVPPPPSARIVYAGNIGPAQELDAIIEASVQLERRGIAVEFDLYGTGMDEGRLKALAAERRATRVHFRGVISPETAFQRSAEALAQIVALRDDPMFALTLPSKLPFCLAAGSPVLYSLTGEAAAVAHASGAGFAFDGTDPRTLVDRVIEIVSLSDRARVEIRDHVRAYFSREFSRGKQLERYLAILLGPSSSARADHPTGSA